MVTAHDAAKVKVMAALMEARALVYGQCSSIAVDRECMDMLQDAGQLLDKAFNRIMTPPSENEQ